MMQVSGNMIMRGALFRKPEQTVRENQTAAMHEATQFVARGVKSRTPQGVMGAAGGLMGSIQPEVRNTSRAVIGIVGTPNPYGLVVEKGRRPGQPPPPGSGTQSDIRSKQVNIGPLVRWIEVKMGVTREEALRIEHPVRWKIAKKGTEGAHMFENTLDEDWADIKAIFNRYGVQLARDLNR